MLMSQHKDLQKGQGRGCYSAASFSAWDTGETRIPGCAWELTCLIVSFLHSRYHPAQKPKHSNGCFGVQ